MEKIKWLDKANIDLIEIYNYISKDSLYYATKTIKEILNKADYLYDFPYIGRRAQEFPNEEYREIIYKSYKIIYEIDSLTIYIHRVWHSARLINNLFSK